MIKDFILSNFQKEAVELLENKNSVIVVSPTGSGKTLIAEKHISRVIKDKNFKVIYTSPLKSISNQKYEDFSKKYSKDLVGLITGDSVINENAQIQIMTTEIFRNRLLDSLKSDESFDFDFVIFDEFHYINNKYRGTVWEESIILMSKFNKRSDKQFLALSGTVSNYNLLYLWLKSIHKDTELVLNEDDSISKNSYFYYHQFGFVNFNELNKLGVLKKNHINSDRFVGKDQLLNYENPFINDKRYYKEFEKNSMDIFVKDIVESKKFIPVLYFLFSRESAENYSYKYSKIHCLLNETEIKKVEAILKREKIENRSLLKSLIKGFGFHHSGLLEKEKKLIEILMSESLIKFLFVTETFSMGVDFPVRTVVIDSTTKYSDNKVQKISYMNLFQILGRSGRRSSFKKSYSVIILDPNSSKVSDFENIVNKRIEPVTSKFSPDYSTIINLIDSKIDIEKEIYNRSFYKFCLEKLVEHESEKIKLIKMECFNKNYFDFLDYVNGFMNLNESKIKKYKCIKCKDIEKCHNILKTLVESKKKIKCLHKLIQKPIESIKRKIVLLNQLKYLNSSNKLLKKGRILKSIKYNSILIVELLTGKVLEKLSYKEIVYLIFSLIFKKGVVLNEEIDLRIENLEEFIKRLSELEFKIVHKNSIEFNRRSIALAYIVFNKDIKGINELTKINFQDIIYIFRRIIELLNQILSVVKSEKLRVKLNKSIKLVEENEIFNK